MKNRGIILFGKALKQAARLRGGGSALPGLMVERLDSTFLARTLGQLPRGVVLITGTNGKTTTTKIVTALLRAHGLRVFTNRSGSNFTRGVASEVLGVATLSGSLPYDIAVLELDEAHATHFIRQIKPRYALVLNVMRDQLDRFGEIDHTARLLQQVVDATTGIAVLNSNDPRVAALAGTEPAVRYFGAASKLQRLFVNDDELYAADSAATPAPQKTKSHADNDVEVTDFTGQAVTYRIGKQSVQANLHLSDVYNFLNAAGALALCRAVLGKQADTKILVSALAGVEPAFGRGEVFTVDGQELELTLVKNPGGFRLALASFNHPGTAVMIAINDNYADGRDMSWLWDIDFSSLQQPGVVITTGIRAYDMALRLQYDDIKPEHIQPNLTRALSELITGYPDRPKRIFCTYTAMLTLRRALAKYVKVERAL